MAKYKLQELNDMRDDGKRRVYPKIVTNRTLSRKEFVKMMQNYHRGISESTTEAVLTDVVDMLTDMLSMGYNVNLEGFGTFSLSLAFEDEKPREILNPDDKMTYRKVGVKDINFKASPEFIKDVKRETDRDLERDMGGVKVIRKQLYSKEERIARALEVIEAISPSALPVCAPATCCPYWKPWMTAVSTPWKPGVAPLSIPACVS